MPRAGPPLPQKIYLDEAQSPLRRGARRRYRLCRALGLVLVEPFLRLGRQGPVRSLCGAYEREAIRPHVLGRFADMLLAVETHPAMLLYLDNARSIGPDSVAGHAPRQGPQREPRARDPRTAYARRAHRLHAGRRHQFRQGDHRLDASCRRATIRSTAASSCSTSACTSRARRPCSARPIRTAASSRAARCSHDLARHPATATHIATKLARHFVADEPPPALVERLTQRFLDTDGDLKEVTQGADHGAGGLGSAARPSSSGPANGSIAALRASGPAGPRSCARSSARRACSASRCGGRRRRKAFPTTARPGSTAWRSGSTSPTSSAASSATTARAGRAWSTPRSARSPRAKRAQTVARAESRPQALALLLMAPEFQRR